MKKIIALFLALVMCLSLLPAAFAEETEVAVLEWADVESVVAEAGIEGAFYMLEEIGLIFWVPNDMEPVEAPDDGSIYLGCFANEDRTHTFGISVTEPSEGVEFENFLAAVSEDEDIQGLEVVVVNGLAVISYTIVSGDEAVANNISMVLDNGSILSFVFNVGDEEWNRVSMFIGASIQSLAE